jgi:WD40 repeat protein
MIGPKQLVVAADADAGVVDAENPWPGLLSFREADQAWFQGRRAETVELTRLVMRERLTVLFGLSGLGKSSLLQAGLFPLLRQENVFPVYIRPDFLPPEPDLVAQSKAAVARQAAEAEIEAPEANPEETLWEYFQRRPADFWSRRNRPVVPLLVFDQFEEIFTLGHSSAERSRAAEAFIDELAHLAEGSPPAAVERRLEEHPDETELFSFSPRCKILLAIREDFLPDLEDLRSRIRAITLNRLRLGRMSGDAALLVVNQAHHLIDESVAEQVVRFVAASHHPGVALSNLEVEPALLSVICRELNNKRQKLRQPKITAGLLEGTQEEVLSNFYERSVADQLPEVRSLIEEHLLTVSGYRDSIALENALNTPGVTRAAIDTLIERRLVRIEDRGTPRLELTHDLLAAVVCTSRDRRRELEAAEQERTALREAENREQRTLRQLRRSRMMAAAFLVLAVVAIAAATAAFLAQKRATAAQKLTAQAEQRAVVAWGQAKKTAAEREIAAQQAEAQRVRAEIAKEAATMSERQATMHRAAAESAQAIALDQAEKATQAARLAEAATKVAEEERQRAHESAKQATQQASEADAARRGERTQREELARALARSDVREAARFVENQQRNQAMAYLSRALREDPASMAARSLIFDLLIRRTERSPDKPFERGGNDYPFTHQPIRLPERVISAAFSHDGRWLVTASFDGSAQVWDVETGSRIGSPMLHHTLVNSAAFSPDNSRVVTASQDGVGQVWDAASGLAIGQPMRHEGPVTYATFSPDGRRVLTSSFDCTVRIWDAARGAPIGQPLRQPRPVTFAAFSPVDGQRVVTASWDNTAHVWDLASGMPIGPPMRHQGQVNSASFSSDGRRVVTASSDNTAVVWEGGRQVGEAMRHAGAVNFAAFSPDARRVVTASDDRTARVWEADTGTAIGAPLTHRERVNSAAFSPPDGRRVVTASYDRTAQVWEVLYDFENPGLLAELVGALGGYDAGRLPDLILLGNPLEQRLDQVRRLVGQAPQGSATASFVRWVLSQEN